MEHAGRLVLGGGAAAVRRRLGPTAWAALEVLASGTADEDGAPVAATSIRDIADALGVATNTAHRATRRLIAAGLTAPNQPRASDGRFVTGVYRLTVPDDVLKLAHHEPVESPTASSPTRPRSTRRRDVGTQLDLLTSCD